jgi:hypothetical protein
LSVHFTAAAPSCAGDRFPDVFGALSPGFVERAAVQDRRQNHCDVWPAFDAPA